jgi:hypothetical protein
VFCIFLFLGAASIFGTLVSQINEIVASQTTISKELDKVLEAYFSIQPRQVADCDLHFFEYFMFSILKTAKLA